MEDSAKRSSIALAILALVLGGLGAIAGLVGVVASKEEGRPALFMLFMSGGLACVLGVWVFRQRLPALLALSGLAMMDALVMAFIVLALGAAGQWILGLVLAALILLAVVAFGMGLFWAAESEGRTAEILRIVLLLGGLLGLMMVVGVVVGITLPNNPSLMFRIGAVLTVGVTLAGLRLLPVEGLGFALPGNWLHAAWPLAAALVLGWAASGYFYLIVSWLGPAALAAQRVLDDVSTVEHVLLFVILAPVAEEVLFRGTLQQTMKPMWGAPTAILTSSVLFAVIHFSPPTLPVLFLAGLTAGLARELSGSLLPCILFHAVYNAWVML